MTAGYALAQLDDHSVHGAQLAVAGAVENDGVGLGLQLGVAQLSGSFLDREQTPFGILDISTPISATVVRVTGFVVKTRPHAWIALGIGYHHDSFVTQQGLPPVRTGSIAFTTDRYPSVTTTGVAVTAEAGIDVLALGTTRVGFYVHGDTTPGSTSSYQSLGLGVAVRR